jgi:hypothetical protein
MDGKMKIFIIIFWGFCFTVSSFGKDDAKKSQAISKDTIMNDSDACRYFYKKIDEVHDWKSMEEVHRFVAPLYDNSADERASYASKLISLSFALRALERVPEAQKKYQHQKDVVVAQMERAAIKGKTVREIALIGVMMVLSETVNITPDGEEKVLGDYLKRRVDVEDVLSRRKQAMEALNILTATCEDTTNTRER